MTTHPQPTTSLWRAGLTLARKDLRIYFRDRSAVLLGFALPIALVTIFGFSMQMAFGGSGAMAKAELWVVDADGSAASAELIADLRQAETIRLRPRAGDEPLAREDARAHLTDGEAHHVLIVEPGYGAALAAGRTPELTLLRDPGRGIEDRLIRLGLMQAVLGAGGGELVPDFFNRQMTEAGAPPEVVAQVTEKSREMSALIGSVWEEDEAQAEGAQEGGEQDAQTGFSFDAFFTGFVPLTEVDVDPPDRPKNLTYTLAQSVSGITVMMLMFGLVACGSTLIEERDKGTLRRLMAAAAPRDAILLGKFLFTAAVGLMQLAVLFLWGELLFGVGLFQRPVTLAALALALAAAVTAFGMLIAVWARTRKQADGFATLLILAMSALGGAWFPIQLLDLPVWAEVVTRCTLTWWAMNGFQQMLWSQASWYDPAVLPSFAVMLGFALGASFLAWRLFRRRYTAG